jgi:hypothetical protein
MTARVLLGNDGSTYVLKISRKGDDVTNPSNPLLFDSTRSYWQGQVYAGGQASSTSSVNWAATKGSLSIGGTNVIPLIFATDNQRGKYKTIASVTSGLDGDDFREVSNFATFETTTTSLNGVQFSNKNPSLSGATNGEYMGGTRTSTGLKFLVLKIPCAFGFMSNTYMQPGTS